MSLKIRKFETDKDSKEIMRWWKKQNWDKNTINVVSDTGFIIENKTTKLAATWVIKTNSPIYLMEWTVGNPDVDWEERKDAIEQLTHFGCEWSKLNGAKGIMIMTKNNRYIEKLKNNKFIESDTNMTHLIRSL